MSRVSGLVDWRERGARVVRRHGLARQMRDDCDSRFFGGLHHLRQRSNACSPDAAFRFGHGLVRVGIGRSFGGLDLVVDALAVFFGEDVRALAGFGQCRLIGRLCGFGVFAMRLGLREIA